MIPRNFLLRAHTKRALDQARQLLYTLYRDRPHLEHLYDYSRGIQADPYRPENASPEYVLLAERAVTNVMQLIVSAPGQSLAIDYVRRGNRAGETERKHWRKSHLAIRQASITRACLTFGVAYAITEDHPLFGVQTRGLSPLRSTALFEDPASDVEPECGLTVETWPETVNDGSNKPREIPGVAWMWTRTHKFQVTWKMAGSSSPDPNTIRIGKGKKHRSTGCPMTRFVCQLDLEGRATGLVEPMIPVQDRINQSVFDLLVAQTFGSFAVRTATGMAPPMITEPVYADPDDPESPVVGFKNKIDPDTGKPIPAALDHNASRFLFAAAPDAKFGSLPGTPLQGYIEALDLAFRHLAALAQIPPHHLLGQVANLSAEALTAAEAGFLRLLGELKTVLSVPWLRVLRLAAELEGDVAAATADDAELIWRDVENRSLAAIADALGKLAEQLDVPKRALWERIPGVTADEMELWDDLRDTEEDSQMQRALERAAVRRAEAEADQIEAQTEQIESGALATEPRNIDPAESRQPVGAGSR